MMQAKAARPDIPACLLAAWPLLRAAAMKGKEELKALNAAQTKRIAAMESRMRRLMAHAAQGTGDVGLMDFFLEAEDLDQANPLTSLREKNK